jgi:hypothetical protein
MSSVGPRVREWESLAMSPQKHLQICRGWCKPESLMTCSYVESRSALKESNEEAMGLLTLS